MRPALRHFACAAALTMFGALPSSAGAISFQATGTPTGFSELAGSRQVLVDVYYGGRKVGEALAAASPGTLRFRAPRDIVSAIPGIIPGPELDAALSADLPQTHSLFDGSPDHDIVAFCRDISEDAVSDSPVAVNGEDRSRRRDIFELD